jgi:hypothetical protein
MVQTSLRVPEGAAANAAVLDRAHLARMTFYDSGLEREILQLFNRQAELLMERMRTSEPAACAHLEGICGRYRRRPCRMRSRRNRAGSKQRAGGMWRCYRAARTGR